jgi:hypothetical protein
MNNRFHASLEGDTPAQVSGESDNQACRPKHLHHNLTGNIMMQVNHSARTRHNQDVFKRSGGCSRRYPQTLRT